jgi:hypothetical protein
MIPVTATGVSEVKLAWELDEVYNWRIFPWESRSCRNWTCLLSFRFGIMSQPWSVWDRPASASVRRLFGFVAGGM